MQPRESSDGMVTHRSSIRSMDRAVNERLTLLPRRPCAQMFDEIKVVTDNGNGTFDFNGTNVAAAYAAEFGGSGPSIETEGGGGTAGGHWNEDGSDGFAFENEIMTGYIDVTGNYLSNTTIAALEDMGYETVFDINNPLDATSGLDMSIFTDHLA